MADETLTRREVFSWAAALPHKEDADFILAHDAALRAEIERLRKVIQYVIDSGRLDGAEEEYVRNELIR